MKNFSKRASSFALSKEQLDAENLRQEFIKIFDELKLKNITIDEYALNKLTHSKNNFCYWIETKLNVLGNIHGNTSNKFGVYYGETKSDPIIKWRWAEWTNENFDKVKKALLDLYIAGKNEDIEQIKKNPLSNMVKGKILTIYFPNRYLNIFVDYHLIYFLDKLNISHQGITNPVDLREKIIDFKNSNTEFASWTAIKFGYYLYSYFGRPTKKEITNELKIENELYDKILNVEVDNIIVENIPTKEYADIPTLKPQKIETSIGMKYKRDRDKSVQALTEAEFLCEIDAKHESFMRKDGKHKYMEPHHLIPMKYQDYFENTLDTPANIISLCSNCHNCLHYGADYEKLLKKLYDKRINRLKKVGLKITFSQLKKYYKE